MAELTVTDGDRSHKEFRIEASIAGVSSTIDLPAEKFEMMRWPAELFGSKAIVKAGPIVRDRAREAIRALSPRAELITVYQHTGLIKQGGNYYFLHAGGAMGAARGRHDPGSAHR